MSARPVARQREDGPGDRRRARSLVELLPLTWCRQRRTHPVDTWIYDFLYAWHIPAFVMVTGYLSRSFLEYTAAAVGLFRTIVVPYFLFEFAMLFYRGTVAARSSAPRCGSTRTGRCGTSPGSSSGGWPRRSSSGTGPRCRSRSRSAWCSRCSAAPGRRTSTSTASSASCPSSPWVCTWPRSCSGGSRPAPPPSWARSPSSGSTGWPGTPTTGSPPSGSGTPSPTTASARPISTAPGTGCG